MGPLAYLYIILLFISSDMLYFVQQIPFVQCNVETIYTAYLYIVHYVHTRSHQLTPACMRVCVCVCMYIFMYVYAHIYLAH